MAKEVVAVVKIKNSEIGELQKEKLCYLQCSPSYLYYNHKYFFKWFKTLFTLEKFLTGKDINYEIELVSEEEIAVERFNKELRNEKPISFYSYVPSFIVDYIDYLKVKTNDKYLLNLMKNFYDKLNLFFDGSEEYYALDRYVKQLVEKSSIDSSKKVKSKIK